MDSKLVLRGERSTIILDADAGIISMQCRRTAKGAVIRLDYPGQDGPLVELMGDGKQRFVTLTGHDQESPDQELAQTH